MCSGFQDKLVELMVKVGYVHLRDHTDNIKYDIFLRKDIVERTKELQIVHSRA